MGARLLATFMASTKACGDGGEEAAVRWCRCGTVLNKQPVSSKRLMCCLGVEKGGARVVVRSPRCRTPHHQYLWLSPLHPPGARHLTSYSHLSTTEARHAVELLL